MVYSGGWAPVGEYYDRYLARPVPAARMKQHLICPCWSVNHPISSEAPRGPGPAAGPDRGARSGNITGSMNGRSEGRIGGRRHVVEQQSRRTGTGHGHSKKSYDPCPGPGLAGFCCTLSYFLLRPMNHPDQSEGLRGLFAVTSQGTDLQPQNVYDNRAGS